MTTPRARLLIEDISHRHGPSRPPRPSRATLDVQPGEWVCVVGPNGSGKSTLLRIAAGLLYPISGLVRLEGPRPLLAGEREFHHYVTYLAQSPDEQILGATASDELAAGAEWHGMAPPEIRARMEAALARLGWEGRGERLTAELSAGERRRLALAAAALPDVSFLVVDEPLAGLDPRGRQDWFQSLQGLRRRGIGVLTATTLAAEAARADRVVCLGLEREGAWEVAPEELLDRGRALALGLRPAGRPPEGDGARFEPDPAGDFPWEFRGAALFRGRRLVWPALDLQLPRSGLTALWAPNGAGKTTLGMALAGLLPLAGGAARGPLGWSGPAGRRRCHSALAFQAPESQLSAATVRAEWEGGSSALARTPEQLAWELGLPIELLERSTQELSHGERRRVGLGAAAGHAPELLVLDEPFAGLDGPGADLVLAWIRRISSERSVVWLDADLQLCGLVPATWKSLLPPGILGAAPPNSLDPDLIVYFSWT